MSEELRLLLRNSVYILGALVVYWFVSYEWAGSVMMLVLGIATGGFVVMGRSLVKSTHEDLDEDTDRREGLRSLPNRWLGFSESEVDRAPKGPLEVAEGEMPHGSVWPLVAVIGLVTVCIGFIYGTWFYVIGIGIVIWGMWGWLTQLAPPNPHEDSERL